MPASKESLPEFWGLVTPLHKPRDYIPQVEGAIPPSLKGSLYRTGPAFFQRGETAQQHVLDGDGLMRAFHFTTKGVRFQSRHVATPKWKKEEKSGFFCEETLGFRPSGTPPAAPTHKANISALTHGGHLYALDEGHVPFRLNPRSMRVEASGFPGSPNLPCAAHTRLDPVDGSLFGFHLEYRPKRTQLHLYQFSAQGRLVSQRQIALPKPFYFHDFFVTEHKVLFLLHPLWFDLNGYFKQGKALLDCLVWDADHGAFLLELDRANWDEEPQWRQLPAIFMWHAIAARSQKDAILLDFIGYDNPDHFLAPDAPMRMVLQGNHGGHYSGGTWRRIRVYERTLRVEQVDPAWIELPTTDRRVGLSQVSHAFAALAPQQTFHHKAIAQLNLKRDLLTRWTPPSGYCGEPLFHPKSAQNPNDPRGWISVEIFNPESGKSYLAILDADRWESGPLANIHLRSHLPFGFHGAWMPAPPSS